MEKELTRGLKARVAYRQEVSARSLVVLGFGVLGMRVSYNTRKCVIVGVHKWLGKRSVCP